MDDFQWHDRSLPAFRGNLGLTMRGQAPAGAQRCELEAVSSASSGSPNEQDEAWLEARVCEGQVHVRMISSQGASGVLELSMKGGAADIQADLEAQLAALRASAEVSPTATGSFSSPEASPLPSRGGPAPSFLEGALPDEQDVSAFERVPSDQWLEGRVHHEASFGIYVTVSAPRGGGHDAWGLVHLTELPAGQKSLGDLSEGAAVRVRLLALDSGRLLLSMKGADSRSAGSSAGGGGGRFVAGGGSSFAAPAVPAAAKAQASTDAASWQTGTVREATAYGLLVEVQGALGLVYSTEIERYPEDPASEFVEGQEVQVRIVDEEGEPGGYMGLSMRTSPIQIQADVDAQRSLVDALRTAHSAPSEANAGVSAQDLELRVMCLAF
ncbi:unnamed protein product [Polarella glacialis]|uniref:S1 motif domain-containing protein n=1 Tax=Polarella glacialis TaxID=89957 RepID=A0A813DY41_POLGL|nr:unnamed protein product [Polarella glacialis]